MIYTVDEGDDWTDPKVLEKANPNMGVSVYRDFLLSQQQRAINNARQAGVFKTKHLNIWVAARAAFYNLVFGRTVRIRHLRWSNSKDSHVFCLSTGGAQAGYEQYGAVVHRKLTARHITTALLPASGFPTTQYSALKERRSSHCGSDFRNGLKWDCFTVTDGAEVDYRYILKRPRRQTSSTQSVSHRLTRSARRGFHMIRLMKALIRSLSFRTTPICLIRRRSQAAIESGRFHHDGNPIMSWCISNVVGKYLPGNDDVVKPIKEQNENKIDGAVSLIMAIGRAMLNSRASNSSVYDEEDVAC